MRIYDNGIYRDMTPEEIEAMEEAQEQAPPRASSPGEQTVLLARALARTVTTLSDGTALAVPDLLPAWEELLPAGEELAAGLCLTSGGQVYRVVQAAVPQAHQPPGGEGMLAVYRPIFPPSAGTAEDPIPWVYGIDCTAGTYYSYHGRVYRVAEGGDMLPCIWAPDSGVWQWEALP